VQSQSVVVCLDLKIVFLDAWQFSDDRDAILTCIDIDSWESPRRR
jgi:hypothetical protein